jgi:translocator assembly and maintenance protein 41
MTDFLLSTPSLPEFHISNLRQNPSHYPLIARISGGERIAWLTDHWGAGVWYVTMANIGGLVSPVSMRQEFQA